jgi:hypothetical protein
MAPNEPPSSAGLFGEEAWMLPDDLYSCWQARGLYSPLQFVLRLRPDVHRALNSAPAGLVESVALIKEQILAFSTYLHETIHWWQHVGTTSGLMLSLLYPAQAHITRPDLISTLPHLGPIKPLRTFNMSAELQARENPEIIRRINVVLNNWHDIEFCRRLVTDPKGAAVTINDQYFESVSHSYAVALAAVVSVLASTIDPKHEVLPDPQNWEEATSRLHAREADPTGEALPIKLPSLGAKEIFEGQARISQLQYLHHASGNRLTWTDFGSMGMLDGVYVDAFNTFLRCTDLAEPSNLDSPIVALFLLVCDLALNPAEGLIIDFTHFESIVETIDPGWRFLRFCAAVRGNPNQYSDRIVNYTADEYYAASDTLCSEASFTSPRQLAERIKSLCTSNQDIIDLLQQDKTFAFGIANLPVRLFAGRFFALQLDKAKKPHFFCWPGICMTPDRSGDILPDEALDLFEEHGAIFLDKEDGDVYPRTFRDRSEEVVDEVFNTFYAWVSTYELTRQWIVAPGEFDCSFSWLTSKYPVAEIQAWASKNFKEVYGVNLEEFKLLPRLGA